MTKKHCPTLLLVAETRLETFSIRPIMQLIVIVFLLALTQAVAFISYNSRRYTTSSLTKRNLFGSPEPPKNTPAKTNDGGGLFGGNDLSNGRHIFDQFRNHKLLLLL